MPKSAYARFDAWAADHTPPPPTSEQAAALRRAMKEILGTRRRSSLFDGIMAPDDDTD